MPVIVISDGNTEKGQAPFFSSGNGRLAESLDDKQTIEIVN